MALTGATMLASSLVSQITSAVTMAKAGGVATATMAKASGLATVIMAKAGGVTSGTFLAGLSSQGAALISQASLCSVTSTLAPLLSGPSAATATVAALPIGVKVAMVGAGGVLAVGAVPVVLGSIGFTGAGITASSLAAKMMSVAAIANGGGVASGSLVATLQSVGAAGLSLSSKILVGSAGSAVTALVAL